MRYRLRTLMIVLAIGPPLIAWLAGPTILRMLYPPTKLGPGVQQIYYAPGPYYFLHTEPGVDDYEPPSQ